MRSRTRNVLIGIAVVLVLLVALGAVPGLLKSGDPYYLTATPVGPWDGPNATVGDNATAINGSSVSELRYPYTTAALDNATADTPGRSSAYWRGPVGIKESFTHSPFDELSALSGREPRASTGDGVYVHDNHTVYLIATTQEQQ
jgi:hypothetical protein